MPDVDAPKTAPDFVREIVAEDRARGRVRRVGTRFPPEPNGYLHIGHAKAICLDFGVAAEFGGFCNLRYDDTNPEKEDVEYVTSIEEDVRWLGFSWDGLFYASDYFEALYGYAVRLVEKGLAYVDDLSADEMREHRGTLTSPGKPSPWRDRSVAENLDLFARMRAGEFADGSRVLRAKIDLASPNINLRDPVLYRIRRAHHHRTGDAWCIYPSYDYAHPLSDAIEAITHSLCTLEFEDHRPLYDWVVEAVEHEHRPRQIEFARLNLTYTLLSKRRLRALVQEGHVASWDDPRMPTLSGLRRRGVPPAAIRDFCERVGVAKRDSLVDVALLEYAIRDLLNKTAPRAMAVLRPLRLVLEDYPEDGEETFALQSNPEDPSAGTREVPFSRVLWIERDDFREVPPPKYHRLSPGSEVRLRGAYLVRCTGVVKDARGEVIEVRCTHDPASRGGQAQDGRRVKGTIHWVSARHAEDAEVRLYDRLFVKENPADERDGLDWRTHLNPASREVLSGCKLERVLRGARTGTTWQFERLGYFCPDADGGWNRTVTLKDTWAKIEGKRA
ncbi:MAG TPA: glutamine--tRNA ligase/YqeY domain fusion protein [Candidatus Polarisedimenticolaceae bacterium]|nr:glutamine--tRNA ligase/YqeY domain fusion protein [Candidatus Polarisedimenticolaceae bacterium]